MKDFDNSFLTILASEEAVAFWLIDMQVDATTHQYFTTIDIDLVINGNRYISTEMSVSPVNYSVGMKVDKMRLEFENVSLTMSATLLNNNVTGQPMIIYGGAMPLNYHEYAIIDNLVHYWDFDENTGLIASDSVGHNHGTITGASWVSGVSDYALDFGGGVASGDMIELATPYSIDLLSSTVSFWAKRDVLMTTQDATNTAGSLRIFASTVTASSHFLEMRIAGGYFYLYGERDTNSEYWGIVITDVVADTDIHHFVLVNDNNVCTVYIDGVYAGSNDRSESGYTSNSCTITHIGRGYTNAHTSYGSFWDGILDEIRFYNRPLTALEVNDLYTTPAPSITTQTQIQLPPDTNLVGYWALDEDTGTNAADGSGNGNDGTITGTSWVNGISGSSLSFNGGSDIVSFSEVTLLHGSWSISYWMVQDADSRMSIGKNNDLNNRFYHVNSTLSTAYLRIHLNDGANQDLYFGEIMQDTGWRHIVVTADGDTMVLYLDGALVDSGTELTNEFRVDCIGNPYTGTTNAWEGELDEVRLYTEALSANEIKALYLNPGGSRQPITETVFRGLTSDWKLDEKKAEITVVDEFVYWNKRSLRKPDPLCPWLFKGTECGYSSTSTLCNKSYARCNALGNTDNFGGFRFFPAMEEKEIWWGKQS